MIRSTIRRARKRHICGYCGRSVINKGDLYRESVASPHHEDLGNFEWWRIAECKDCAERYGLWSEEASNA